MKIVVEVGEAPAKTEVRFSPAIDALIEEYAEMDERERAWNTPRPFYDVPALEKKAGEVMKVTDPDELERQYDEARGELDKMWGQDAAAYRNISAEMDLLVVRAEELRGESGK